MDLSCVGLLSLSFSSIVNKKNKNLQPFFSFNCYFQHIPLLYLKNEKQIVMPLYPIAMHIIAIFERETNWGFILGWDSCTP